MKVLTLHHLCHFRYGNKAEVWQKLIDDKKLPYMATVRNLRNLVLAGISSDHVAAVCKYLSNPRAVAGSRMFPFRFYTAFDALNDLEEMSQKEVQPPRSSTKAEKQAQAAKAAVGRGRGVGRNKRRGGGNGGREGSGKGVAAGKVAKKDVDLDVIRFNKLMRKKSTMNGEAIAPLRAALEKAVKTSTAANIPPLQGVTVVLCSCGYEMNAEFSAARGLMKKGTRAKEAAFLMALMCHSAAEVGALWLYGERRALRATPDPAASLLSNVDKLLGKFPTQHGYSSIAGSLINEQAGFLRRALADAEWIDNLVLIHAQSEEGDDMSSLRDWIARYRASVNGRMIFASVNVGGKAHESAQAARGHPLLDLYMSGFSEQIFTCLAGLGNGGQLEAVETVGRRHKVDPPTSRQREMFKSPSPWPLEDPLSQPAQQWRRVKIFISSTFVDMHGERDLINRFVIPELKRRARQVKVDLSVVDLRWGVTPSSAEDGGESFARPYGGREGYSQLLSCLREAQSSHLFVGLLGERYGWKPAINPADLELDKNRELRGRLSGLDAGSLGKVSITEMEIATSVLSRKEMMGRSLFFFRNSEKLAAQLPTHLRAKFFTECEEDRERLVSLKESIRRGGHEVYDGYPATFAGVVRELPVAGNLEEMGRRLLKSLWAKLQDISERDAPRCKKSAGNPLLDQDAFARHVVTANYVARPKQVESITRAVKATVSNERAGGLVEVQGKAGAGVSTLLCKVYAELKAEGRGQRAVVVPYFASADADADARSALHFMARQLAGVAGVAREDDAEGAGIEALAVKVASLFQVAVHALKANAEASKKKRGKKESAAAAALIVVIDGLEGLKGASGLVEWIPQRLPTNSTIVISTRPGGTWAKYFASRKNDSTTVRVGNLDLVERKALCRHWLGKVGKRLEETAFNNQLNLMIGKRDATNAGYLKMLTEEMVNFGIYEELEFKLREAGGTFAELQAQILDRLEEEVGEALVQDMLGVLSLVTANGYGMTEDYLQTALTFAARLRQMEDSSPKQHKLSESYPILLARKLECAVPRLSALQLSMALSALEPFLQPTKGSLMEGLLLLREGEGLNAIVERYLVKSEAGLGEQNIHDILAAVFERAHERDGARTDPIALHALPLHLAKGGHVKALQECVCRLSYVADCAQNGVVGELISHLRGEHIPAAAKGIRQRFAKSSKAEDFARFVTLHGESLARNPSLIYQLALNEPADSQVRLAAETDLKGEVYLRERPALPPLILEWSNRPPRNATLSLRRNMRSEITVSRAEQSTAIRPDKLLLAHGLSDGSITVNLASDDTPLFSLVGHAAPISALCFVSGGSSGVTFLASGADDGSLCVWDLDSRVRQSCVQAAHARRLSGLAASADGLTLVSVGWDCLIKIWQGRGVMREVSSIAQNPRPLNCVAYHPDKDFIIVGGWEGLLKIYDLNTHERKAILRGHGQSIRGVEISRDARRIVSCGMDGACKVFDSQIGAEVTGFEVGQAAVDLAVATEAGDGGGEPGSGAVLVGCRDGQVQSWSMRSGADPLFEIGAGGEGRKITCLRMFSYGRGVDKYLALGFEDGTVQVARCGDAMPFSERDLLPGGRMERKVAASPIEEMWCAAPSAYTDDDSDRVMAGLFDDEPAAAPGEFGGEEAGNVVEVVARCADGACHFVWQAEFTSELKHSPLDTGGRGAVVGAFRLPYGTWLVAAGTNFLFFVQGKKMMDVVSPLWEQEACYRPMTAMAQSTAEPEQFATCDDRGEIVIWRVNRQPRLPDLLERMASCQIEDPNAFCPTSLSYTTVTSGHTEAAVKAKKDWVAAASDTSAELRFYAIRDLKSDNDSSPRTEVSGEMQVELSAKLEQKSLRGPIKSLSAVDQHLVCAHVGGGASVWSNKGVELRWLPSTGSSGPSLADALVFTNRGSKADACLLLVAAAHGNWVNAFNPFQSVCLGSISAHSEAVHSVTLVRDGAVCCSSGRDATFRMWDVRAAAEEAKRDHYSSIVAVRTVHDGKISVSLCKGGILALRNISGKTTCQRWKNRTEHPTLMDAEMASDSQLIIAMVSNRDVLRLLVVPVTIHQEELQFSEANCVFVKEFADELAAVTILRTSDKAFDIELLAVKQRSHEKYYTLTVDITSLLSKEESGQEACAVQCSHSSAEFHEIR